MDSGACQAAAEKSDTAAHIHFGLLILFGYKCSIKRGIIRKHNSSALCEGQEYIYICTICEFNIDFVVVL